MTTDDDMLKIIYCAFLNEENRTDKTKEGFATGGAFYIFLLLFILIINNVDIIHFLGSKVLLGIIYIGVGFGTYWILKTYAEKQLETKGNEFETKLSVSTCRLIYFFWKFTGPITFITYLWLL